MFQFDAPEVIPMTDRKKTSARQLPSGMTYDADGRICWTYVQDIRRHPMTLYVLEEMMIGAGLAFAIIAVFNGYFLFALQIFLAAGGVLAVAGLVGWLIWSFACKGKYVMTFAMNDEQIVRTSPPGVTGGRDGGLYVTRYKNVRRLRSVPEHDMVGVMGPWSFHQIYAAPEQFQFVLDYMTARCNKASVEQ
jgi:hypothetical protein